MHRQSRRPRATIALAAAFALCLPAVALAVPVTTVAVFDAPGAGAVESSATPAPNDATTFTAAVATASAAGLGGVINFDLAANATGTTLEASYAAGGKTLNVTSSDTFSIQTFSAASPVSGTRGLLLPQTDDTDDNATLTFGPITGGLPGEAVTTVGFALLSRDTDPGAYTQTITVTATFSDGSTAVASDTINDAVGTDDTFFGFTAPVGQSIVSLAFNPTLDAQDSRVILDDLGFVTSVVPEPTGVAALALAATALVARRRRLA